jgi:hypothetical protein
MSNQQPSGNHNDGILDSIKLTPRASPGINVESFGFDPSESINPTLIENVSKYRSIDPISLIGYGHAAAEPEISHSLFVKCRPKVNIDDNRLGKEVHLLSSTTETTPSRITNLTSGAFLGDNIYQWVSTSNGALFLKDRGGSETPDLWEGSLFQDGMGTMAWSFHPLIENPQGIKCGSLALSKDETTLVFTSNKRNGKDSDIYIWRRSSSIASWRSTEPYILVECSGMIHIQDFRYGKLIFAKYLSSSHVELHLATVEGSDAKVEAKRIIYPGVSSDVETMLGTATFSKSGDDGTIYVTTNAYTGEFESLSKINYLTGDVQHITCANKGDSIFPLSWDVESFVLTPDNIVFVVNDEGLSSLYTLCQSPSRYLNTMR